MGGGKGTSTSTQAPPKEIMEAYKQSLGLAGQAIKQPYQQYQGQMVAGLNPTQLQGMANVNAAQGTALPYIQQGAGYVNQAAQGVNPQMINQFMSPYLSNVVNATQRNLLESNAQQQAALKAGAIQSGAFGGDRSRFAQAEMARQQGLAGGQVIGGLLNQGYGQALAGAQQNIQNMMQGGNMLGALGMNAQQSILQGAQAQMAAGAQQQATEQAMLQAQYDQFLQRQAYPYQQAQFFANIAQGIGAGAGGTTQQTPAAPSWGSQLLGGLTAIGSIASMMPSDERVKENIVEVGKTHDGQKIYKYNYKGDKRSQIGLLAQEVEKRNPEAVGSLGDIKMVDYDKATERSEKSLGGSSMGGLVTPDMERQAFAQGGFGMVPYADYMKTLSWVPAGELTYRGHSPGSTLPEGYKMSDLEKIAEGSDFDELNALSSDQVAKIKAGLGKIGTWGSDALASFGSSSLPPMTGTTAAHWARGGLVRHGYATDGAVEDNPFNTSVERTLGFEGGLLPADTNGTPTNFGINQAANPDIDVKNITQDDARKIYKERYWNAIGGDELAAKDPKLAHVAFDTAVIAGPGRAKKILEASGGDPMKFMALRSDFLKGLVTANPEKYGPFAKSWANRDAGLVADISGDILPSQGVGNVPMDTSSGVVVNPASDNAAEPARKRSFVENIIGQDISENAKMALLAAGLGMLGGRSPYFGVNVGKGGLLGLQSYYTGLTNEREAAKAAAQLTTERMNAETNRMQAQTAREQMIRTLYTQILPLVQFYQAEGRPIPPEYQSIIDEALSLGITKQAPSAAPSQQPAPAASPAPSPEASPVSTEGPTPITPPAVTGEQPTAPAVTEPAVPAATEPATLPKAETELPNANPELARLFSQLPDDQNPYKLLEKAGRAMTFEMKKTYTDQANALMQQYRENGIPLPSGTVLFPGAAEAAAEKAKIASIAQGEGTQITEFNDQMSDMQTGFAPRTMIAEGLRDSLSSASTGRFTEFKTDLVNAAASLGLANAKQIEEAADAQTAMKYFAQGILDSGMKDKIGPQISNADLMLVAKGQGTVENLPEANRNIIGAMYGKLLYDKAKVEAWDKFVQDEGGLANITTTERRQWERKFGEENNILDFVKRGKAETPVAGELNTKRDPSYFKEGWKYVDPRTGRIFVFKGFKEVDGKKVPQAEFVN